MATLAETVDDIFEAHPGFVSDAQAGNDAAKHRLIAKVMEAEGVPPDTATACVTQALDGDRDFGVDIEGFDAYMHRRAERGDRSEWTAEAYAGTVRKFASWYADAGDPGTPPTASNVISWLDHLAFEEDCEGSTIQRHFHGMKAYFAWEDRAGELEGIDVDDKYPDRSGGTPDALDWAEVEALRAATVEGDPDVTCRNTKCGRHVWTPARSFAEYDEAPRCPDCDTTNTAWFWESVEPTDPLYHAIVQLFTGFGMRVGELVALDVDDVDLSGRTLHVERQKRKQTWVDPMHLLDRDVHALEAYLDSRETAYGEEAAAADALFITNRPQNDYRAHTDFIRGRLNRVAIAAEVRTYEEEDGAVKTHAYPHLLRHSVGARLSAAGYSEFQVAQYLGHARGSSTQQYMSVDRELIREMRETLG